MYSKTSLAICIITTAQLISLGQGQSSVEQPPLCHPPSGSQVLDYLCSKRPYHYDSSRLASQDYVPEGCTPVKFWYFGRHGTRYPGEDDIEAMQHVLPDLFEEILTLNDSSLYPESLAYFRTWEPRPDLDISRETHLHKQGKYELQAIASRYISRFPTLFPPEFNNATYYFKYTKSQRTKASAKAFASSIFGKDKAKNSVWFPKPQNKDPVLKFYSVCPKWKEEVDDSPQANIEHDKFAVSAAMNRTIAKVSKRSGLNRNLTLDEITIVYTTCAFETAWMNGTVSQWCVLFDLEDFKVMSYREDLEYFWKDGYGYEINYEQACPPFVDAVKFFDEYSRKRNGSYRKVQAYFSHSGATLKMLARLGLFNATVGGGEIRSDNFEKMKDVYEWRTSLIDFMANNMVFVLYECEKEQTKIGFFSQEIPTSLEACGDKAFCDYEEFKTKMREITEECDLQEICQL